MACFADLLGVACRDPQKILKNASIVIVPEVQINQNEMEPLTKDSINRKVRLRVDGNDGERDKWHQACFLLLLDKIDFVLFKLGIHD